MAQDYFTLTPDQREIVLCPKDAVFVTGISGTGKTLVLLVRAYQTINQGESTESVSFLTTTPQSEAAVWAVARDLQEKIELSGRKKPGLPRFYIGTWHRFCVRLLRTDGWRADGISPDFTLLSADEERTLVMQVLQDMGIGIRNLARPLAEGFLDWYGRALLQWEDRVDDPPWPEYLDVMERFEAYKDRQRCLSPGEPQRLVVQQF